MPNKPHLVKCTVCGTEFELNDTTYHNRIKKDPDAPRFYCKEHKNFGRSVDKQIAESKLSEEEKLRRKQAASERAKKQWASYDDAKRQQIHETFSKAQTDRLASMNDEKRNAEIERFRQMSKDLAANRTNEERAAFSKMCSERNKKTWANMSEEKYKEVTTKQSIGVKRHIASLDKSVLDARMARLTKQASDKWNSYDDETKAIKTRERFANYTKNKSHNLGNMKFENMFAEFKLDTLYTFKNEYKTTTENGSHSWDYGIFGNDVLIMLVDIDGDYFHGDLYDYDGVHNNEIYDLRRSYSAPDNIPILIFYDNKFQESGRRFNSFINKSYDEYINQLFTEYRNMPFPSPLYSTEDLLKSWNMLERMNPNDKFHYSLDTNTREGDRLCLHFHQTIWTDKVGELSPHDAWNNDDILKSLIRDHVLYHSYLNKNKILQGFNICEKYQRRQFISGGKAKMLINAYLRDYQEIFNPNDNYSGIMLGALSLGKKYVGIYPYEVHLFEAKNMLEFLNKYAIKFNCDVYQTPIKYSYECLFVETTEDLIPVYMEKYQCSKYLFIAQSVDKYKSKVCNTINDKYVILI